jgi:hypothetical protein
MMVFADAKVKTVFSDSNQISIYRKKCHTGVFLKNNIPLESLMLAYGGKMAQGDCPLCAI